MREPPDPATSNRLEERALGIEECVVILGFISHATPEEILYVTYGFVLDVRHGVGTVGLYTVGRHRRPAVLHVHLVSDDARGGQKHCELR